MSFIPALILVDSYVRRTAAGVRQRVSEAGYARGGVTLEMVIIVVGLMAVAVIAVIAITSAVQSRVDTIK